MSRAMKDIAVLVKIQDQRDMAIRLLMKVHFQGYRSLADGDHYAEIDQEVLAEIDSFLGSKEIGRIPISSEIRRIPR